MTGIYKIENKKNHMIYIGQACDIKRRWNQHCRSFEQEIDKAIHQEGLDNFDFSIVELCTYEELNTREVYWISYYNSFEKGYNDTRGGTGIRDKAIKLSLEDIKEIYELLLTSSYTQTQIAALYNVGIDTISEINQGKTRRQPNYIFPLRNNKSASQKEKKQELFSLDEQQLLKDFKELKSFTKIGEKYNVSRMTISRIALKYNYTAESLKKILNQKEVKQLRPIVQMDLSGKIIKEFASTAEAGSIIHDEHIKQVCDGKRKTSKGYIYRYKDLL